MLKQIDLRDRTTRVQLYITALLTFYIIYFLSLFHIARFPYGSYLTFVGEEL